MGIKENGNNEARVRNVGTIDDTTTDSISDKLSNVGHGRDHAEMLGGCRSTYRQIIVRGCIL
jgi:hypothetical protein